MSQANPTSSIPENDAEAPVKPSFLDAVKVLPQLNQSETSLSIYRTSNICTRRHVLDQRSYQA